MWSEFFKIMFSLGSNDSMTNSIYENACYIDDSINDLQFSSLTCEDFERIDDTENTCPTICNDSKRCYAKKVNPVTKLDNKLVYSFQLQNN